jgi:hypothetical protein
MCVRTTGALQVPRGTDGGGGGAQALKGGAMPRNYSAERRGRRFTG